MAAKNGNLPDSSLRTVEGGIRLTKAYARAWFQLATKAALAGVKLTPNSGYRSGASQRSLFTTNYTTTPNGSSDVRRYDGKTWYRRPGKPSTAPPGTSNHGWGNALDIAGIFFSFGGKASAGYAFLKKHAGAYGITHPGWAETQRDWEPWHWEKTGKNKAGKRLPFQYIAIEKVKSFQCQLGSKNADGIISVPSDTIKRMQRRINADAKLIKLLTPVKVDGLLGPHTVKALKKWLNVRVKPLVKLKPSSSKWNARSESILRKSITKGLWN